MGQPVAIRLLAGQRRGDGGAVAVHVGTEDVVSMTRELGHEHDLLGGGPTLRIGLHRSRQQLHRTAIEDVERAFALPEMEARAEAANRDVQAFAVHLAGREVARVIVVPGKLVNVVI